MHGIGQPKPARIFISYAHEDIRWRDYFKAMLAPVVRQGRIDVWSDENLQVGEKWFPNIKKAMESAQIGLLLVTDHFLNSEFIQEHELKALLDSARAGGVSIRWVPVSASLYQWTELGEIQACHDPEKTLDKLSTADRKKAIEKICREIVADAESCKFVAAWKVSPSRQRSLREQVQERLGKKYIIKDTIASGKLAIIYRAERIQPPKQTVAVKVLVASELDEGARKLFIDGATRAIKLTSPAFIKVFDHSMEESPEYLVSEFVVGEQLNSYLRGCAGGLPLPKVKSILLSLAEALEEVHKQGFCRGNMCPSDILIQASGMPRLSPFDFSNLLREDAQLSGSFLVDRESLTYMTPEWFFGNTADKFTDQYSLGLIATELLGGTSIPRVKNLCDLEHRHKLFDELQSGQNGDWTKRSRPFTGLVCKMLSTDPTKRWGSMSDVRERLQILDVAESPGDRDRMRAMNSYLSLQAGGMTRDLYSRFYENLFSVLPEVKRHFQSISMEAQHNKLNLAIDTLLKFCPGSEPDLAPFVPQHGKFGLTRHHYDVFLDTLVATINELGENDPQVLEAWRKTLKPGIDFMWDCQEKYRSRRQVT